MVACRNAISICVTAVWFSILLMRSTRRLMASVMSKTWFVTFTSIGWSVSFSKKSCKNARCTASSPIRFAGAGSSKNSCTLLCKL